MVIDNKKMLILEHLHSKNISLYAGILLFIDMNVLIVINMLELYAPISQLGLILCIIAALFSLYSVYDSYCDINKLKYELKLIGE